MTVSSVITDAVCPACRMAHYPELNELSNYESCEYGFFAAIASTKVLGLTVVVGRLCTDHRKNYDECVAAVALSLLTRSGGSS